MVVVINGAARCQLEHPRAPGAESLLVHDPQPDPRMPERPRATVAGDDPAMHLDRLDQSKFRMGG